MIILALLDSISAILIYGVIQRLLNWTGRVITPPVIPVPVMVLWLKSSVRSKVLSMMLKPSHFLTFLNSFLLGWFIKNHSVQPTVSTPHVWRSINLASVVSRSCPGPNVCVYHASDHHVTCQDRGFSLFLANWMGKVEYLLGRGDPLLVSIQAEYYSYRPRVDMPAG